LALKDGELERHWESVDGKEKTSQIVIPHSKVKEVLAEIREYIRSTSGG